MKSYIYTGRRHQCVFKNISYKYNKDFNYYHFFTCVLKNIWIVEENHFQALGIYFFISLSGFRYQSDFSVVLQYPCLKEEQIRFQVFFFKISRWKMRKIRKNKLTRSDVPVHLTLPYTSGWEAYIFIFWPPAPFQFG